MQSRFWMAALLGFVLIAASACGGSSGVTEEQRLREQLQSEQEAREEAEQEAADLEEELQSEQEAREKAEQEAADAEDERLAAEAERQRLQDEQDQAERAAAAALARAAFEGLGGAGGSRTDAGTVSVTPRYGQTATVTATPIGGLAVEFGNKRRSSASGWSVTTLSNAGSTHNDDLLVYSDIGGPTQVLITALDSYTATFTAVPDTNNIRATLTGNTHPIASSRFPSGGRSTTFEHTIDSDPDIDGPDGDGNPRNDYDTTRFSGTYDGASGTFECTGTCTVDHRGGRTYDLSAGTWTFTTSKNARVPVDDDSFMYFGWWKREQKSDESLSFFMFSDGAHEVADITAGLTGAATYTGPVVGQYAIYQPLGTQNASGSFTARAVLEADFGAVGSEGTLSGRVTNFSNASDWSVALKSTAINTGTVAGGSVSWTIAGNTEDGGMWDAQFFSNVDGSTAYPEGVAGTFDAEFADVGHLIGAFGAHCSTSDCPRN